MPEPIVWRKISPSYEITHDMLADDNVELMAWLYPEASNKLRWLMGLRELPINPQNPNRSKPCDT